MLVTNISKGLVVEIPIGCLNYKLYQVQRVEFASDTLWVDNVRDRPTGMFDAFTVRGYVAFKQMQIICAR
jgi:hypothetical protein